MDQSYAVQALATICRCHQVTFRMIVCFIPEVLAFGALGHQGQAQIIPQVTPSGHWSQ